MHQRQTIKSAPRLLRSVGALILDNSMKDEALRPHLFKVVPREALTQQIEDLDEWVTDKTSDVFHGIIRRQSCRHQFSLVLLLALSFFPDCGSVFSHAAPNVSFPAITWNAWGHASFLGPFPFWVTTVHNGRLRRPSC